MCTSSQKAVLDAHYELMLRWNAKLNLTRITVVEAQKQPIVGPRGYFGRMQDHENHAAFFTRSSTRIPA